MPLVSSSVVARAEADGAPGVLEVSPGGEGFLLLRAHLPYWEGLIHVVGQAGQMLGIDGERTGAWSALEADVQAVVGRGRTRDQAAVLMEAIVTGLGTFVPGLPGGLTHTFPEAAALSGLGLPAAAEDVIERLVGGR
ncbi:hypothetical protein GCM10009555_097380 [Acrocarpospora macrocephala]|uniref:Uncharacterized protein n=1 Tax=Acrocarpospora macrocephala TaxID=150177 RepID=A0A5M3X6L3_9ACTN|nr:hypothetical protein [Acrocarpospora macrocephala]GES16714.1 hypothetical protein Amac_103120 [Acrocarpospora macrocephala]